MTHLLALAVLILLGGLPAAASAHGTERHFGTPINGRAPDSNQSRGAPEFTVLAIGATLKSIERDLAEERPTDARERARRVLGMTRELVARCEDLGPTERDQVGLSARVIADGARRIDAALDDRDGTAVRDEMARVREQLAALDGLLHRANDRP